MSFGENLKKVRKQNHMTQEALAELLGVSRQAVSKWESDNGYPETEKLLALSKTFHISLDELFSEGASTEEKVPTEGVVHPSSGTIAIPAYDGSHVVICQSVKCSPILWPGKNEPKYILNGIDKVTFWGEHTVLLGWYATKENIEKEMAEITAAIGNGEGSYKLKYCAQVQERSFGFPKLKQE